MPVVKEMSHVTRPAWMTKDIATGVEVRSCLDAAVSGFITQYYHTFREAERLRLRLRDLENELDWYKTQYQSLSNTSSSWSPPEQSSRGGSGYTSSHTNNSPPEIHPDKRPSGNEGIAQKPWEVSRSVLLALHMRHGMGRHRSSISSGE